MIFHEVSNSYFHYLSNSIFLTVFLVFERLGTPPVSLKSLKGDFYNLKPGCPITIGSILFTKIEVDAPKVEIVATKPTAKNAKKTEQVEDDPNQVDFTKMDFRVGVITKVWHHETAERLFCEEIDVGDDLPRQVASGLRQHYTLEEMNGRRVVVVCNLKESKLQGFLSFGMVLAAKTEGVDGKIVLLEPPSNAAIGDRVYIDGLREGDVGGGLPALPAKVKKLKIWESVSPDLSTDATGTACWKGRPLLAAGEPLTAPCVPNSPIS